MNSDINIIIDAKPLRHDINFINDYISLLIFSPLSCPLFIYDSESKSIVKYACKEYNCSDDGKTHIFKIKDDLFWSNGEKVTIYDYYESFLRIMSEFSHLSILLKDVVNLQSYMLKNINFSEVGFHIEGDALIFRLNKSNYKFYKILSKVNFSPIKKINSCDNYSKYNLNLFAGAFYLNKKDDYTYSLSRNKYHFNYIPNNDSSINFIISNDKYNDLELYSSNQIDLTCNTMFPYEKIKCSMNLSTFYSSPSNISMYLLFRNTCLSMNLRKAIMYLIDTENIRLKFFKALTPTTDFFINNNSYLSNEYSTLYNQKLGIAYLNKYKIESNKHEVNLSILYDDFYPNKEILTCIQKQLQKYKINLILIEDDYYFPDSIHSDLRLSLCYIDYFDNISIYQSLGLIQLNKFKKNNCNPLQEYINLINKYKSSTDQFSEKHTLNKLNSILIESSVILPLFKMHNFYFKNHALKNINYGEDFIFDKILKI